MNTKEIEAENRLRHWSRIMKERKESGQSIKSYCESVGLHENVYYYWQRKLREAACHELVSVNQNNHKNEVIPSGWAVCSVAEPKHYSEFKESTLTLEIGKCRITAAPTIDLGFLSKVCEVLMPLC